MVHFLVDRTGRGIYQMVMPRKRRVEYPCAMYHVMSRGDRREDIFLDDVDRYLAAPEHRPGWMRVDRLMGEHGLERDTAPERQEFERRMEARRLAQTEAEALKSFRRGWCLGGEAFKRQRLEQMEGKLGEHHSGELRREAAEAKAERIVAEELSRLGWTESDLATRRKSDPGKLGMGARLRKETTLSLKAIARRVCLGTSRSASVRLHDWMKSSAATPQGS